MAGKNTKSIIYSIPVHEVPFEMRSGWTTLRHFV